MNHHEDARIAWLAAFDVGPIVHLLLTGCTDAEMRSIYRQHAILRVQAAMRHLEQIPSDLRTAKHLAILSDIFCDLTSSGFLQDREEELLQAASNRLCVILAEREGV